MKLLFVTDLIPSTLEAFQVAIHVTKKFNGELNVLHIKEEQSTVSKRVIGIEAINKFRSGLDTIPVYEKEKETQNATHIPVSYHVKSGNNVRHEILDFIEEHHIDFLCMPSQGRRFIRLNFFGGHTTYFLQHSPIPVIAIPVNMKPERVFAHVSFATDLKEIDYLGMHFLIDFFSEVKDVTLTSIHIDVKHIIEFTGKFKNWRDTFRKYRIKCYLSEDGNLLRGIDKFVDAKDVDTICFVTKQQPNFIHNIFNVSVAADVAYNKDTCVISIPRDLLLNQT